VHIRFPKFSWFRSLAFRYSLFFLTAILIIFFIAFAYSYGYSIKLLVENAQKDADNLTEQTITRIENVILPVEIVPVTLVHALESPNTRYSDILRIARDFIIQSPVVFGTCLAFEPYAFDSASYWHAPYYYETSRSVKFRMLGGAGYDYFTKEWYRLPKLLKRPVWSEPYFDKGGGDTLMCTYSVPIFKLINGQREFIGVLTMDVSLGSFDKIVKAVKVYKTGYGFLVSQKGIIITFPDSKYINKSIVDIVRAGNRSNSMAALHSMLAGKKGFTVTTGIAAEKKASFISYGPVASTGWSFGVIFPANELLSDLLDFLKKLAIIFGISVLTLFVITILITRKFTRPIIRLVEATRRIGQGDFNAQLPKPRSKDEIAQLTNAFASMQVELVNFVDTLQEATVAKEKIESELNVAHTIQMGMLPKGFVTREDWDLYAVLEPARAVGGDLYDFFFLDSDHLCIAIADVAGKGVPASLFMMVTRTLLRAKAVAGLPLEEVITGINKELCQDNPHQMFVTFFAGVIDLRTGVMEFCNCGHSHPWFMSTDGKLRTLKFLSGIPLGIFDSVAYKSSEFIFHPGELLLLNTDGVPDALALSDEFFGDARLAQTLSELTGMTAKQTTQGLIRRVQQFAYGAEQADDITILALKYNGTGASKPMPMQNIRLKLVNQVGDLDKLVATLEEVSSQWNLPSKVVMEVNLSLEELFTNIVFYAYDNPGDHVITIDFQLKPGRILQITLTDDGKPFNLLERNVDEELEKPIGERQIGGLGIHFVREMMDGVDYKRLDNKNVVILTKNF
jgi:sigma-B regulation protein RsbU (phosphoserine phosphatase)